MASRRGTQQQSKVITVGAEGSLLTNYLAIQCYVLSVQCDVFSTTWWALPSIIHPHGNQQIADQDSEDLLHFCSCSCSLFSVNFILLKNIGQTNISDANALTLQYL